LSKKEEREIDGQIFALRQHYPTIVSVLFCLAILYLLWSVQSFIVAGLDPLFFSKKKDLVKLLQNEQSKIYLGENVKPCSLHDHKCCEQ